MYKNKKIKTESITISNKEIIIDYYDSVDSTMSLLKEKYIQDFYTVIANSQENGYGRYSRSFESNIGGVYFSTQIKSSLKLKDFIAFNLVTSLSILKVLRKEFPSSNILLKYPNDIFLDTKKIGGVLIENINNEYYVLGVGLNIETTSFSDELKSSVTSLKQNGLNIDSKFIFKEILLEITKNFVIFEEYGFKFFKEDFSKYCLNLRRPVSMTINNKKQISRGIEILESGLLKTRFNGSDIII